MVYQHLSSQTEEQIKYPSNVKQPRMTMKNIEKQKIANKVKNGQ